MHKSPLTEIEKDYVKQAVKVGVATSDIVFVVLSYRFCHFEDNSASKLSEEINREGPMRVQREITELRVGVMQIEQEIDREIITKAIAEVAKEELDERTN